MKGKIALSALLIVLMVPLGAHAWVNLTPFGPSGAAAPGPLVKYVPADLPYDVDPAKTALFIIDPQKVYSAPLTLDPAELADGKSPLNCDQYSSAIANIEQLATACKNAGIPIFLIRHVYEADGSNCGRLCDFDPLGSLGFPKAWNLWRRDLIFSELDVPQSILDNATYYAEKSIYSSFTLPVAAALKWKKIDTVIITGFMTQYCSTTATRHGHDLGFKMIYVSDANDGPQVEVLLGGPDENAAMSLWLGIPVADVTSTSELITRIGE
ncbi:MAG: isochorismatase family protein [Nitrospirota bacterium]